MFGICIIMYYIDIIVFLLDIFYIWCFFWLVILVKGWDMSNVWIEDSLRGFLIFFFGLMWWFWYNNKVKKILLFYEISKIYVICVFNILEFFLF